MRTFQDEYQASVVVQCGLTRDGSRRWRLTRKEWQTEKAASNRLAKILSTSDMIQSKVTLVDKLLNE